MRKFILIAGFGIAMLSLTSACSRVDAQGGNSGSASFEFDKYSSGGKEFSYPGWRTSTTDATKVQFVGASGKLKITTGYTLTRVTLKFYPQSGPILNSYSSDAWKLIEADTITGPDDIENMPMIKKWTATWITATNDIPTTDKDKNFKVVVEIRYTQNNTTFTGNISPDLFCTAKQE